MTLLNQTILCNHIWDFVFFFFSNIFINIIALSLHASIFLFYGNNYYIRQYMKFVMLSVFGYRKQQIDIFKRDEASRASIGWRKFILKNIKLVSKCSLKNISLNQTKKKWYCFRQTLTYSLSMNDGELSFRTRPRSNCLVNFDV